MSSLNAWEQHGEGFEQSVEGTSLNITSKFRNVWLSKLFVDTKTKLEADTKYRVTANISSEKSFDFELCYNNGDVEKGYSAIYNPSIGEGETKDIVHEFTTASHQII